MTGPATRIPTEDLDEQPWSREKLQAYLDNDPQALALALWAHARVVAIYGLDPVAGALASIEGSHAADLLTTGLQIDKGGASLPLTGPAAWGISMMFASAALGMLEDTGAENYVESVFEVEGEPKQSFDQLIIGPRGSSKWVFEVHRLEGKSPHARLTDVVDALLEWHDAKLAGTPSEKRQADAKLHGVAAAERELRDRLGKS